MTCASGVCDWTVGISCSFGQVLLVHVVVWPLVGYLAGLAHRCAERSRHAAFADSSFALFSRVGWSNQYINGAISFLLG